MPGPLPNPNARRTSRGAFAFIELPAHGRVGPPPPWPLPARADGLAARRAELWAQLWALPAAVLWEQMRWPYTVARFVELTIGWEAEPGGASGVVLTELRRLEEQLAITRTGALRARVRIAEDPVPASGVGAGGSVLLDLSAWRATHGPTGGQALDEPEPEPGDPPRGPAC